MLCLATTHCPADVKDTETTLVQSPASTLAHSLVGHRLLAWSPAVSCTSPDLRLHPQFSFFFWGRYGGTPHIHDAEVLFGSP
nr:hypothetical protein Iba_chr14fCG8820 [Ipomoea batatas]